MNSLANGNTALSSVGGTSGVFNQSNTGSGMQGQLFLTLGTIGSALIAGAAASVWFIPSYNGGTNFETTVTNAAQPRPPDGMVALPATGITGGSIYVSGMIPAPPFPFKVFLQNNTGQTFAASANTLLFALAAMQY